MTGEFMSGWSSRAAAWCMVGAIEAVQGYSQGDGVKFVRDYLCDRGRGGPIEFNDALHRTQEQVIDMFDEMIAFAKDSQYAADLT